MSTDTEETETGEDELTPCQKMSHHEIINLANAHAHDSDDDVLADILFSAAGRIERMGSTLRLALSALEAEFCQRQDSGDDEYISAIRAPMDAVRDALGAWEE